MKVLSLASCNIQASGASAVAAMLKSIRCGIQYLSLECNTLGGQGIGALCAEGFNSVLQVLNIASTGVASHDSLFAVNSLGPAIRNAKSLVAVDFNLNVLTPDSAAALSLHLAKAKRDGSKIEEFIVTTSLDHESYRSLALDPSLMSAWSSRVREKNNATLRRTPTPSPFDR